MTRIYTGYNDILGNPLVTGDTAYVLDGPDSYYAYLVWYNGRPMWRFKGDDSNARLFDMPSKREVSTYWSK